MKIDRNGWEYYDKLPVGFRLATLADFTDSGKRKMGMQFLIKWSIKDDYYQICSVSVNLYSKNIILKKHLPNENLLFGLTFAMLLHMVRNPKGACRGGHSERAPPEISAG